MQRPLIPSLISLMGGIILGNFIYVPDRPVMISLFLFLLLLLVATVKRWKSSAMCSIFISLFFLGILNINYFPYSDPTPINISRHAHTRETLTVEGVISQNPLVSNERTNLVVATEKVIKNGRIIPVEGRILLSLRSSERLFNYGDLIRAKTRLKTPRNFNNPGGLDYKKYLGYRGIRVRGFIDDPSGIVVIRENRGNPFTLKLEKFRTRLRRLIEKASPYPEGTILKALIIGERKEIPKDIQENFNRTGISHVLAISGLHIGIIAFLSIIIVRFIMKSSEYFLLRFNIIKASALFAFIPVIVYAFIAGFAISTVRATIMILTFLVAILSGKERELFNTLALAAFAILVVSPGSLFDISFQLSFTAVAAILFIGPALSTLIPKGDPDENAYLKKARLSVFFFILISISAILGTIPLIAFYFNRVSTVTLLSNIMIIPIIGFLILPIGMATIVTVPISIPLATLLIKISSFFIGVSIYIVNCLATLPLSSFFVTTPTLIEIAAYYLLLITVVKLIDMRNEKDSPLPFLAIPSTRKRLFKKIALKVVLALLVLFFMADGIYIRIKDTNRGHLKTTFIDVGRGSSTLVQFPGGIKMLVDGGGFYDAGFDIGRYVVAPFLWHERIKKIDIVVLSHPQSDHLNGLIYILDNFDVGEVWSNGETADTGYYKKFTEITEKKGIPHRIVSKDTPAEKIGAATINILNPEKRAGEERGKTPGFDAVNNNSLVMKVTFKKVRLLLPADISEPAESRLVASGVDMRSDVLMAPHHGGFRSSTNPFLDRVRPQIVVVSSGTSNNPDILKRYRAIGSKIFMTHTDGAVTIITDGDTISTQPFNKEPVKD